MTQDKKMLIKYGQAAGYLPPRLRGAAMQLDDETKACVEEFRLRAGRVMSVTVAGRERNIADDSAVRHEELNTVLELATHGSVHTSVESICGGYVTVAGGHRIGICGTAVNANGSTSFIKNLSSVSIRIAKEIRGVAEDVYTTLSADGKIPDTLIISPPGCGKTTMLRDLVRLVSENTHRVSLVDERGELAAKYRGVPQFDVGGHTDVMDGMKKSEAIMLMLRAMTPDIIAVDEITAQADIEAMECACNCGVVLIATAHGYDAKSIFERPLYRRIAELGIFSRAVILEKNDGVFSHRITEL